MHQSNNKTMHVSVREHDDAAGMVKIGFPENFILFYFILFEHYTICQGLHDIRSSMRHIAKALPPMH